jgi:CSLREA domain-containing protein
MSWRRLTVAAAAAITASLAFAASASAATVEVDTTVDENFVANSDCSLREAINLSNADVASANGCTLVGTPGADTVTFALASSATIDLTAVGDHELVVTDTDGLTITGPGIGQLTISAPPDDRVIESTGGVPLTISDLTIQDGNVSELGSAQGGGIRAAGNLSLTDVLVSSNHVTATADTDDVDASAGGVYAGGTATITNSVIENNTVTAANPLPADDADPLTDGHQATATGGGIFGGTITITDSTIAGNTTTGTDDHGSGNGEGVHAQGGGIASPGLTLNRSTVSGNDVVATAPEGGESAWGGGIFSNGPGLIELSTIAGNTVGATGGGAGQMGGGIINFGSLTLRSATVAGNGPASGSITGANLRPIGTMTLGNTIVADPVGPTSTNCDGGVATGGFNIDSGVSCGLDHGTTPSDQEGIDPMLDSDGLEDNGGPTETIRPLPSSPAIDAGSAAGQTDATHDQRGLDRPVNALDLGNADEGSDVGAFEVQAPAIPTLTATNPLSPSATDTAPQVIGTSDFGEPSGEGATQIVFFSDSACEDQLAAINAGLSDFGTSGLQVDVPANATTTIYAHADSNYTTQSACSSVLSSNGSITYTHDSLGPVMTIDGGPTDPADHTPTFSFHGVDLSPPLTFMCSVDTGTPDFNPCTSPFTAPLLADGSYTFRVKATDALVQEGAATTHSFSITTPAPPAITPPPATLSPKKCKKGQKLKKGKCVKKKKRK